MHKSDLFELTLCEFFGFVEHTYLSVNYYSRIGEKRILQGARCALPAPILVVKAFNSPSAKLVLAVSGIF